MEAAGFFIGGPLPSATAGRFKSFEGWEPEDSVTGFGGFGDGFFFGSTFDFGFGSFTFGS